MPLPCFFVAVLDRLWSQGGMVLRIAPALPRFIPDLDTPLDFGTEADMNQIVQAHVYY